MVTIWDVLVNLGSIGFIICTLPQGLRTWKTRSAGDISWVFLIMVLLSSGMMFPYLLHEREWMFAAAQAVNIAVWGLVAVFKARPAPSTRVMDKVDETVGKAVESTTSLVKPAKRAKPSSGSPAAKRKGKAGKRGA